VTDPPTVIITHLTEVIRQHAHELLTRQEAQALIDHVREQNKAVVEELIPNLMTLGETQKVLQNLLRERVSIRDMGTILETLADWAPRTKDIDQLSEYARTALARQICKQYADDSGALHVMTLDAGIEQTLRESVQITPNGVALALSPGLASALVNGIAREVERVGQQGYAPILLCSSQIRLALKRLTERNLPNLTVLAYNEIVPRLDVRLVGTIEMNATGAMEFAA
jgi:flagellar biosynthesis protein FlhA